MELNEMQEKLLSLVCSHGGGITVLKAMEETGLDYPGILDNVKALCSNGYQIGAINVGRTIYRLYLSPYDSKHTQLMDRYNN